MIAAILRSRNPPTFINSREFIKLVSRKKEGEGTVGLLEFVFVTILCIFSRRQIRQAAFVKKRETTPGKV